MRYAHLADDPVRQAANQVATALDKTSEVDAGPKDSFGAKRYRRELSAW